MKPKIVLLSAFLTPLRSGAEACAEEIAHRLYREFAITIVTARLRKTLPEDDPFRGQATVVRVGIGRPLDKWLFPFLAPFAVRRIKPQIVHAVLESFAGIAMVFCRWLCPGAKTVLTCQSTNTSFLVPFMHRRADRVTVISRALQARALACGRSDALLLPNGIDLPGIERACADFKKIPGRILFVGRLEPMKGVDVLLRAMARALTPQPPLPPATTPASLRQGFDRQAGRGETFITDGARSAQGSDRRSMHLTPLPPLPCPSSANGRGGALPHSSDAREGGHASSQIHWHLRIVGRGSQERELKRLADDLKIGDRVVFVGFLPAPRVFEEFAQAQVFCGLSRSEALGNVFLEAQAAGCAVVATRVGGIPDIVEDGRTGLLVPPDDAEAAALALTSVLTDAHQWSELAEAGMAHARSYDWSGIVERYAEVYRSLLLH